MNILPKTPNISDITCDRYFVACQFFIVHCTAIIDHVQDTFDRLFTFFIISNAV